MTILQGDLALAIFKAGVNGVLPEKIIRSAVTFDGRFLNISERSYDLDSYNQVYLIGAGKASAAMALSIENLLSDRISDGCIITKYGHSLPLSTVRLFEAGHPVPDQNGIEGTEKILEIVQKANDHDLILLLLSGGASSLLIDVPETATLQEIITLYDLMIKIGMTISEINTVRKHLSKIKGGQLLKKAAPSSMLTLIISDVVGDDLSVIASGPTVADPTTYQDALFLIRKFNIESKISPVLIQYLEDGNKGIHPETLKTSDLKDIQIDNILIGNNMTALLAAKIEAESHDFLTHIIKGNITGDVEDVADYILQTTLHYLNLKATKPIALLFGGEPTVNVTGKGKGGRNQHLTLIMAEKLIGIKGVTFLSGATDGNDGNTDASGAICDFNTVQLGKKSDRNTSSDIRNFDSYHFFESINQLIKTGPTNTNVMDIMIVLIEKQ